jgi:hypothetical protein
MDLPVRDGQRDTASKLSRDFDIGRTVFPVGSHDEEHRTDRLAAGD